MAFATLTPLPGVNHAPQTQAGAWAFPFEGQWQTITDEQGRPRPLDLTAARAAEAFFTQRPPDGEPVCLVQVQLHEGEQEYRLPQPTKLIDPETGQEFETMEQMIEAVKARTLAGVSGPESKVSGPESKVPSHEAAGGVTDNFRDGAGKGGK